MPLMITYIAAGDGKTPGQTGTNTSLVIHGGEMIETGYFRAG